MDCHSRCSCKCQLLGSLEDQIMEILWSSPKPLKPAEVRLRLKGEHAYTTIMTVLKRLSDKKILKRQPQGKFFLYFPAISRQSHVTQTLDHLLSRLLDSYGPLVSDRLRHLTKS